MVGGDEGNQVIQTNFHGDVHRRRSLDLKFASKKSRGSILRSNVFGSLYDELRIRKILVKICFEGVKCPFNSV